MSSVNFADLTSNLGSSIDLFFSEEELDQLAREAKFVQRESKLKGSIFLGLLVFHGESLKAQSLNDLTINLDETYGIQMRKQSLHERFNRYALLFLKKALEKMLQKHCEIIQSLFTDTKGFKRILLKDSTCFQIDKSLATYYPGSGGNGSPASVRIQFEYDVLNGTINDLSVNPFNHQDATNSVETIHFTKKGDLIIRDLAYMSLEIIKLLEYIGAYYLCRANTTVKIYEKNGELYCETDFVKIMQYMKKHGITSMEKKVYYGAKEKIAVRLILYRLPDEEYNKRIRKIKKNNNKKCRGALSKETKARAAFNLFITNASTNQIHRDNVWSFYRLRWQIELIFKVWKSMCNIAEVKKVKKDRLECYIYSKLLLIMLGWKINWRITQKLFKTEGKELSILKASKTLYRKMIGELINVFMFKNMSLDSFMNSFYELSKNYHVLEKRKNQPTSFQLLLTCLCP